MLTRSITRTEPCLCTICYNTLIAVLGRGQSLVVKIPLMQLLELRYDTVSRLAAAHVQLWAAYKDKSRWFPINVVMNECIFFLFFPTLSQYTVFLVTWQVINRSNLPASLPCCQQYTHTRTHTQTLSLFFSPSLTFSNFKPCVSHGNCQVYVLQQSHMAKAI